MAKHWKKSTGAGAAMFNNRESCAEIPAMASQVINLIHIPHQDLKIA